MIAQDHHKYDLLSITGREIQVLNLISKGFSTPEIANNLYISTETVKTHRSHLMRKMEANNAAFLIRKAFELNLIQ